MTPEERLANAKARLDYLQAMHDQREHPPTIDRVHAVMADDEYAAAWHEYQEAERALSGAPPGPVKGPGTPP